MSLNPGDYSLDTSIGDKFPNENYLVISVDTGVVWTFESEEQVQKFLVGRNIKQYSIYSLSTDSKIGLEKEIYGEEGQFDRFRN